MTLPEHGARLAAVGGAILATGWNFWSASDLQRFGLSAHVLAVTFPVASLLVIHFAIRSSVSGSLRFVIMASIIAAATFGGPTFVGLAIGIIVGDWDLAMYAGDALGYVAGSTFASSLALAAVLSIASRGESRTGTIGGSSWRR